MHYQFDHLLALVKKLSQPSKTASVLNLASWKESSTYCDQLENFEIGMDKAFSQVSIEVRRVLLKCQELQQFPYRREPFPEPKAKKHIKEIRFPVPEPLEDFESTLQTIEKAHIIRVLYQQVFNKTRAAKVLGITVKTLYNKIEAYQIKVPTATLGKPRKEF